ncbi:MAG: hypothetical protein Q9221_003336 [Calogaya cf. arnoldii]
MDEPELPLATNGQLDDFLRVDTHETDSEPDFEDNKEPETGIRDIHLEDLRQWPGTMYLQIYSIPETWLSLVSQTTRLANVMDVVNASNGGVPYSFSASLRNKSARLETMICSQASKTVDSLLSDIHSNGTNDGTGSDASISATGPPSEAMLRALNSALVIFFYRRIRDVHPCILQIHVNEVIEALKDFDRGIVQYPRYRGGNVGTPWPAFMAGCEAMTSANRDWLIDWLENCAKMSPSGGHRLCIEIMREVWRRRNAATAPYDGERVVHSDRNQSRKKADTKCTWIHVLRDRKQWPMLY